MEVDYIDKTVKVAQINFDLIIEATLGKRYQNQSLQLNSGYPLRAHVINIFHFDMSPFQYNFLNRLMLAYEGQVY